MAMGPCARHDCNGLSSPEDGPWCSPGCRNIANDDILVASAKTLLQDLVKAKPHEPPTKSEAALYAALYAKTRGSDLAELIARVNNESVDKSKRN